MEGSTIGMINETLERECDVYMDMLDVSRSKKTALIKGKISELEKLLEIEQTLLLKAGRIGSEREALADQLANEEGIDRGNNNISTIIETVENEETSRLENTREKFIGVLTELDDTNKLNSTLVQHSLEYISFSINLLNSIETGSEGYGKSGKTKESKGRNYLDLKL